MTHFLATEDRPDGYKLEDILSIIRADIVKRAHKIADDRRGEALDVLENDIKIMSLLSECIRLAESSTGRLNKAFGPHRDGKPRIGHG